MEHLVRTSHNLRVQRSLDRLKTRVQTLRLSNLPGRVGAITLAAGLIFAMATDGDLPFVWSKLLFGSLVVTQIIVIDWLVR